MFVLYFAINSGFISDSGFNSRLDKPVKEERKLSTFENITVKISLITFGAKAPINEEFLFNQSPLF